LKLFKQFTLLRLYIAICAMALSAFTYAEYYGYLLTGSDESTQKTSGVHGYSGSRTHHK
jgi:hypothetical protein